MVVVDSDHAGEQYLRGLRDAGLIVCVIDDLASHPFPVHLVINGDAHAEALPYLSSTGDTRFLTGPKYAILRSEFWQVPVPERSREVQTVLLTLGGGDPSNLMPRLITHLGTHFRELSLVVIQGPFFENGVEIKRAADCFPGDVEILSAPSSVVSAMLEADVAISSGGQTLYELARVGCPTIAIGAADNQTAQMESLANFGAIQIAGRIQDPSIVEMCTRRLVTLAEGSDARRRMSVAGRSLVDGGGALRVVRALEDLTQSTSFSPTKNGVA
jgi:spore coat polysaccharide biosynthesis predicted glycosyltransferase SpsG